MTKTFFNVDDDFVGIINIAGQPQAYEAGDMIILDSDAAEVRAITDLGAGSLPLTNAAHRNSAITALIQSGDLHFGGVVGEANPTTGFATYSLPVYLHYIANGEVARFKPGFVGRVTGWSFHSSADATTASKAATLSLGIEGEDTSDEINTVTVASLTTPFVLVVETPDETYTTAEIAYDASPATVKTALVTAGIATGDVTVGGSAGALTFTWTADLADVDITLSALRNEIVTVVVDATGGDFTLDYDASGDPETIVANATQAAFQSAVDTLLAAYDETHEATVVRSGSANSYTYTITGHNGVDLKAFSTVATGLTGGAGTATRTVVQAGGATSVSAGTTVAGGVARVVGSSGNPATLDLTSAAVTDGGVIAGETIATGTNPKHGNFADDDEIVLTAASVTTFVEGAGTILITLAETA